MLRKRTYYRIYCALFLLLLVGVAFFGAYSGNQSAQYRPHVASGNGGTNGGEVMIFDMTVSDLVLAAFTLALVGVGYFQYRQLKRTNDTADAIQRPYIFVSVPTERLELSKGVDAGLSAFIRYTVSNFGKIPAIIEEARTSLTAHNGDLPPRQFENAWGVHKLIRSRVFADGGATTTHQTTDAGHDVVGDDEVVPVINQDQSLFFQIWLRYRGPFTSGHETRGCWVLDKNVNRFRECGGTDYNYTK